MMSDAAIQIQILADIRQFNQRLASLDGRFDKFTKQAVTNMKKVKNAVDGPLAKLGKMGLALQGLAIGGGIFGNLLGGVTEFDDKMHEVNTLLRLGKNELQGLKQEVIDISAIVPKKNAATDLAGGLYEIVSAGFAADGMLKILKTSSMAAVAGRAQIQEAALVITKALNIYRWGAEKATYVSDLFFKTVEQGQTTFPELANQIGRVLPMAKSMNIEMDDALTIFAGLTTILGNTEQAATAMEASFRAFIIAEDKFAARGIDIKKVLSEEGLIGAFKRLRELTGGNATELKALGFETEALRGVLGLFNGKLDDLDAKLQDMRNSTGATQRAFNEMKLSFRADTAEFWNVFTKRLIELSRFVLPVLSGGLKVLTTGLNHLFSTTAAGVAAFFIFSKLLTGTSFGLIKTTRLGKLFTSMMTRLRTGTIATAGALRTFKAALISTGIGALIAGLTELGHYLFTTEHAAQKLLLRLAQGFGWIQKTFKGYAGLYNYATKKLAELQDQEQKNSEEYKAGQRTKAAEAKEANAEIQRSNQELEDYLHSANRVGLDGYRDYLKQKLSAMHQETAQEQLAYEKLRDEIARIEKEITATKLEEMKKRIDATLARAEKLAPLLTDDSLDAYLEQAAQKSEATTGIVKQAWLSQLQIFMEEKQERKASQAAEEARLLSLSDLEQRKQDAIEDESNAKRNLGALIQQELDLNSLAVKQAEYNLSLSQAKREAIDAEMQRRSEQFSLDFGLEERMMAIKERFAVISEAIQKKGLIATLKTAAMDSFGAIVKSLKSAMELPPPANVIMAGITMAAVIGMIRKAKSIGSSITAFAKGGVADNPILALLGEDVLNSGPELVLPTKTFHKFMQKDAMPQLLAQVNGKWAANTQGIEKRLDRVENAIHGIKFPTEEGISRSVFRNLRGSF